MKGILLNSDFTLKKVNGRLVVGDITAQNQTILIIANKGSFKSRPMRGVGANLYLEDHKLEDLAREIRTEFIADGMTVNSIKIPETLEVEIDAYYAKN
ncbi:hypothetical protein [Flavobacterium sp.]|uniref:hypothetical protein n=1 Tax=Flavobacterium sp. TaxID=239 RepID=UPI00260909F2|nr:hypothetical protein [Flavobacterium sp.]